MIENYNPHWFGEKIGSGIRRDEYIKKLDKELNKNQITFLIGLRRIGKTTLIKQFIDHLQTELGIEGKRILYLSLDHPILQQSSLGDILREFRKMNELSRREKVYLFLDELLYMKDIFQWLKVLQDNERIKIYGTSSSSLLKDQKAYLTGRHKTIRIKPLSFKEYLRFRGKDTHEPHLLERYFEEYLRDGGIPEYVLERDINYLVDLVNDILTRDILSRYKVANPLKLKELFMLLVNRIGKPITYSKLARLLSTKEETVEQYLSYLSSSELVHIVYRWSRSVNERVYSPKKIYLGDVGFRYALTGRFSSGSNLENLLFLEIMEKNPYYYMKGGIELDFITETREIYECKLRELSDNQKELLERLKREGFKVHLITGYRDFI